MSSSLRDIPGAGGGRRRDRLTAPARTPRRLGPAKSHVTPATGGKGPRKGSGLAGKSRRRSFGSKERVDRVNLAIGLSFVALALVGALWLWNLNKVSVAATGVESGATIAPQQAVGLTIELTVSPATRIGSATLTFDGEDVTGDVNVERTDHGFVWHAPVGGLENGSYAMTLAVPRVLTGTAHWTLHFKVEPPD